jgi:predicted glutamine amidotransferase
MARLLGLIANRPDLCNRFAEYERQQLTVHRPVVAPGADAADPAAQWGWGVGFYQNGEILMRRRPLDDSDELQAADMIADVRSDIFITHVRRATVGDFRTDNTHPFRYRQWMFAETGTILGWGDVRDKLLETLPKFLQRSVRGDTDSELFFHLFLSFLHDSGKLDRPMVAVKEVFPALKSSLNLLDRISKEAGAEPAKLNVLVATPDYLVAGRRGAPMGYRVLKGREDFEPLFSESGDGNLRMPDLEPCRLAVVGSDFHDDVIPSDWTEVPEGAMIAFTRTDDPVIVTP